MNRARRLLPGIAAVLIALFFGWLLGRFILRRSPLPVVSPATHLPAGPPAPVAPSSSDLTPTTVYAHNLRLRRGPDFRIYIDWISGEMQRTHRDINPSLDDPNSFVLQIEKGVIHANIGDIANYLNAAVPSDAPLKKISIEPDGDLIKIHGTLHKVVPLPVEIIGSIAPTPEGYVRLHVLKLSVLKVPVKGLLSTVDVQLSDLLHSTNVPGIQIAGNDLIFNTETLLPPPHIHGELTTVRVQVPDIEVIYGNAPHDQTQLAQWHNFIRFRNGAIDFGKLTMHDADITMIDATNEPWFDLDLVNYQAQVVNGFTQMTGQAGLEIYMPSLGGKPPKQASPGATLQWLKNRNTSLPSNVRAKAKKH